MKKIIFSIFFLIVQLTLNSELYASENKDYSSSASLKVTTIEFDNLYDNSRLEIKEPPKFNFFRRNKVKNDEAKGRKIPLKVHAPITGGPYPIILISHGAGGNWDSHYAQAQHLASHGYVVICLEHVGSNTERLKSGFRIIRNLNEMIHDSNEVLARPKDISFAIDRAIEWNTNHEILKNKLDINHIGVMGHSFGAYTSLVVSGVRPALDWIEPKIAPGKGLGPDFFESRLKAGVALSPQSPGDPFFIQESYSSLRLPMLGISGTLDKQSNGAEPIARYESFNLWPTNKDQNKFIWLTNARHLDFTDSDGGEKHGRASATRADVQPIVRASILLFFNSILKKDLDSDKELTDEGLKKYLRGQVTKIEIRKK
jgi:dienelactone hydrolase